MSFCSFLSSPHSLSLFSKTRPSTVSFTARFRASADADVPDFLSADWFAFVVRITFFKKYFYFCQIQYFTNFRGEIVLWSLKIGLGCVCDGFWCLVWLFCRLESRKKRPFGPRLNVNFHLIMLNEQNTYVSYCSCRFPLAYQSYPRDFCCSLVQKKLYNISLML